MGLEEGISCNRYPLFMGLQPSAAPHSAGCNAGHMFGLLTENIRHLIHVGEPFYKKLPENFKAVISHPS